MTDILLAAYSAAMDFALALLPWKLIWGLKMRTREKIGIGIAMSMGVLYVNSLSLSIVLMLNFTKRRRHCHCENIYDFQALHERYV